MRAKTPDNLYVIDDDFMRALFNENQEVIIANSIYVAKNDIMYEIHNKNFMVLEKIRNEEPLLDSSAVTKYQQDVQLTCVAWKASEERKEFPWDNKRQYKIRIALRNFGFIAYVRGKVVHYKWRKSWWFGKHKWRKTATRLGVRVDGLAHNNDCTIPSQFMSKYKQRRWRRQLSVFHFGDSWFQVVRAKKPYDMWVIGYIDNLYKSLPLTW